MAAALLALASLPPAARAADAPAAPPAPAAPAAPQAAPAAPAPPASPRDALWARLPAEARADWLFLEHLGWHFAFDPAAAAASAHEGSPARRADLAAARAAGDLRIVLPASPSDAVVAGLPAQLAKWADDRGSRIAWLHRLAPAVERATARLAANTERGRYRFPTLLVIPSPFFALEPPAGVWRQDGEVFHAVGSPSRAIQAFYEEKAVAECYVAQVVATWAAQFELYGPAAFDAAWRPEEVAIADALPFRRTAIGRAMDVGDDFPWRALVVRPEERDEDPGVVLARIGPKAFAGATGIVLDLEGRRELNDNLVFVSATEAATASLLRHGGFAGLARLAKEGLEHRLATRAPFKKGREIREHERAVAAILADPAFSEIRVYNHPRGVLPLAGMIEWKWKRNQAAVEVVMYYTGREDAFYRRYREAFRRGLLGAAPPAPAPAAPAGGAPPAPASLPPPGRRP